jgi:hypothetical protein
MVTHHRLSTRVHKCILTLAMNLTRLLQMLHHHPIILNEMLLYLCNLSVVQDVPQQESLVEAFRFDGLQVQTYKQYQRLFAIVELTYLDRGTF